jgi:hypothetical protein
MLDPQFQKDYKIACTICGDQNNLTNYVNIIRIYFSSLLQNVGAVH